MIKKEIFIEPSLKEAYEQNIKELAHTVTALDEEVTKLKDIINSKRWDAFDIEQEDILETVKELRRQERLKDIEISSLRDSRDMYQVRNAELIRSNNAQRKVLKNLYKEKETSTLKSIID